MKLNIEIVILNLSLCFAVGSCLKYQKGDFDGRIDMPAQRISGYMRLRHSFEKVNAALIKKLPNNSDPQDNLDAAKVLLDGLNENPGYFGGIFSKNLRKAYELFVSLGSTEGRCDSTAGRNLIGNYLVHRKADELMQRTKNIWQHYRDNHARDCLPIYEREMLDIRQNATEIDKKSMKRVDRVFSYLDHDEYPYLCLNHLKEPDVRKRVKVDKKAIGDVISQIMDIVRKENKMWDSVKPHVSGNKIVYPEITKEILDEYLYEPCKRFVSQFHNILVPALFDSANVDVGKDYFNNGNLFSAIVSHRRCLYLNKSEEYLFSYFSKAWDEQVRTIAL